LYGRRKMGYSGKGGKEDPEKKRGSTKKKWGERGHWGRGEKKKYRLVWETEPKGSGEIRDSNIQNIREKRGGGKSIKKKKKRVTSSPINQVIEKAADPQIRSCVKKRRN